MKPTLIVMAAGVGSRYGGLKQIDPVGPSGEIMLDYSVFDALRAGFGKAVFIIRRDMEKDFKAILGSHFTLLRQDAPCLGTGRSILRPPWRTTEDKNGVLGFRRRSLSYGGQVGGFRQDSIRLRRIAPRLAAGSFTGRAAVEYVFQELTDLPPGFSVPADRKKPWGTGHAVLRCKTVVKEPFAVINADDFYGRQSYAVLADYLRNVSPADTTYAMVGFRLVNTLSDHGSVTRGVCETDSHQMLMSVMERFKIEKTARGARYENEAGAWTDCRGDEIASMNMFGFTPTLFAFLEEKFPLFLKEAVSNPKAEFLLPSIVNTLIHEKKVTMKVLQTPEQWHGVTHKEDKPIVSAGIRKQIAAGVYPDRLWR